MEKAPITHGCGSLYKDEHAIVTWHIFISFLFASSLIVLRLRGYYCQLVLVNHTWLVFG